jgi:hypothetical protein
MKLSEWKGMDSASIQGPATRLSWISAQAITPVRPRPPMVACSMSALYSALQITSPSLERCRPIWLTCVPKFPRSGGFSVDVVGDRSPDGDEARAGSDRKEPSFREEHVEMSERLTPLSQRSMPVDSSKARKRLRRRQSISSRPALRQESP